MSTPDRPVSCRSHSQSQLLKFLRRGILARLSLEWGAGKESVCVFEGNLFSNSTVKLFDKSMFIILVGHQRCSTRTQSRLGWGLDPDPRSRCVYLCPKSLTWALIPLDGPMSLISAASEVWKLETAEFRLAKEPAIKGTQGRFAVGQSIRRLLPIRFSAHPSYF